RTLRQELPVEPWRLTNQVPEPVPLAVGDLRIEDVGQRGAEDPMADARLFCLAIPPSRISPGLGRSARLRSAPLRPPPQTREAPCIAVVALGGDTSAADPRIERVVSPRDRGLSSH